MPYSPVLVQQLPQQSSGDGLGGRGQAEESIGRNRATRDEVRAAISARIDHLLTGDHGHVQTHDAPAVHGRVDEVLDPFPDPFVPLEPGPARADRAARPVSAAIVVVVVVVVVFFMALVVAPGGPRMGVEQD